MDHALHAMLESLPPSRRRSKLDPYAPVIRALRTQGRSYREIVAILRERCGVSVGLHTVYHFAQAQARKPGPQRGGRRAASRSARPPGTVTPPGVVGSDRVDAAWARIAAVKQPGPARVTAPKAFVYDETEPLQLAETMPKTDERT